MSKWPPTRFKRADSHPAFSKPPVFPRPRFPSLPHQNFGPRHRGGGSAFPGRFPPPLRPRFRPPPPLRSPSPYPPPHFRHPLPRIDASYEHSDYPAGDYFGQPPPRARYPPPDLPRSIPPINEKPKIPSLLSLPQPPMPPLIRNPTDPPKLIDNTRPRRTLCNDPPPPDPSKPSTSQGSKSEFIIIDYGHNSSKNDLSKAADFLCFDYNHGAESKPMAHSDSKEASDHDEMNAEEEPKEEDYSRSGEEFFYRLALDAMNQYDKSYEQSIWDYDPKFTWDYLPGTSRGTDEAKEFVVGKGYYEEETKWKRHKQTTELIYSHEIAERKAKLEKGESLFNEEEDKPISVRPADIVSPRDELFRRFENEIGFPEQRIKDDYCGICGISFESVLSSAEHYEGTEHETKVRQHFVIGLLRLGVISKRDEVPKHLEEAIIKRALNKYKTRPENWTCELCGVVMSSLTVVEMHLNGTGHRKRQQAMKDMYAV